MVVIWFSAVELRNLQSIDNWTAMTKLVIFDLDGTLLDTVEDLGNATNYALRMCGFPERPLKDYYQLVGRGIYNLFRSAMQAPDEAGVSASDASKAPVPGEAGAPTSDASKAPVPDEAMVQKMASYFLPRLYSRCTNLRQSSTMYLTLSPGIEESSAFSFAH